MSRKPAFNIIERMVSSGILSVSLIATLSIFLFMPIDWVMFLISDDAYYYILVAKNIAVGNGSTFDGLGLTNGYHPLWMLVLILIFFIVGPDVDIVLNAIVGTQACLGILSIWICWRFLFAIWGKLAALTGVLLFLLFASPIILLLNGLESALLLFWLFFILLLDQRYHFLANSATLKTKALLGFCLAVLTLIRLDCVFLLVGLVLIKLVFEHREMKWHEKVPSLIHQYSLTIVIYLFFQFPYFAWNYYYFGHLGPISGVIKSSFPEPILGVHFGAHTLPYVIPFILTVLWVSISATRKNGYLRDNLFNKWRAEPHLMLFSAFWLGCVLQLIWSQLFMSFGVYQWHFVMYVPVLVVLYSVFAMTIAKFSITKIDAPSTGILTLLVLVTVAYNVFLVYEKGAHHTNRKIAASWLKANSHPTESVLITDAGVFGFFSERPTINLDGLINSYAFQDSIIEGSLPERLRVFNTTYIAESFADCDYETQQIRILGYRGANLESPIGYNYVAKKKDEVYLSEPQLYRPLSRGEFICFAIWRYVENDLKRL